MIFLFGAMILAAIIVVLFAYKKRHMSFSDAMFNLVITMFILIAMLAIIGISYTTNVGRIAEMKREQATLEMPGDKWHIERYNEDLARFRALRSSPVWPGFLLYPKTDHLDFIEIVEGEEDGQTNYRRWDSGNFSNGSIYEDFY